MAEVTGISNFTIAKFGSVNVGEIGNLLAAFLSIIGKLFDFLMEKEKNEASIILCQDCGYWERM